MPRVICTKPNASQECDGICWGKLEREDGTVLVSEELEAEKAERYLRMPGYEPFKGSETEAKKAVAAYEKDRVRKLSGEGSASTTIQELQALVDKLTAERRRLQDQVDSLTAELEARDAAKPETPAAEAGSLESQVEVPEPEDFKSSTSRRGKLKQQPA